ncbi:hypothetical protein H8356DRAFT_1419470 [Neocallimastix lanati (nom. inval.)]|nr:hypothetical protein H8356DRAFT_1419470 [Neocallimastix sp. JGI-2020a]
MKNNNNNNNNNINKNSKVNMVVFRHGNIKVVTAFVTLTIHYYCLDFIARFFSECFFASPISHVLSHFGSSIFVSKLIIRSLATDSCLVLMLEKMLLHSQFHIFCFLILGGCGVVGWDFSP